MKNFTNTNISYIEQLKRQLSSNDLSYLNTLNLPSAPWAHEFGMIKIKKQFDFSEIKSYIYILELSDNKYYVGQTQNPKRRIFEHFCGKGPEWTKIHKPVKVLDLKTYENICENEMNKNEEMVTLEYFHKYGLDAVRGAKWSHVQLYYPPKIHTDHIVDANKKVDE